MSDSSDPIACKPDPTEPFSALAFKTNARELVFVRIFSGQCRPGDTVLNTITRRREQITHIFEVEGDEEKPLTVAGPGCIVALRGLKATSRGHTLSALEQPRRLGLIYPEPVMAQRLAAEKSGEEQQLAEAVATMVGQDPTLRVRTDRDTNQLILSGLGECHLKVAVHKLKRDFGLAVDAGRPVVAYRQTLSSSVEVETQYSGGSGVGQRYALIRMRYEPIRTGLGQELGPDNICFEKKVFGIALPDEFIASVEAGFRSACQRGSKHKFPCVDIKGTLVDGQSHVIDSTAEAFRQAAEESFWEAQARVGLTLLEPIMNVIIEAPSKHLSALSRDVRSRRGEILKSRSKRNRCELQAHIPLAELSSYTQEVEAVTGGAETFSMEPSHYAPVHEDVADLRAAC